MIKYGVSVTQLLESEVFCHAIEFEDWPAIHTDPKSCLMPYHGSMFQLKNKYREVFSIHAKKDLLSKENDENKKFYKIKYTINILPAAMFEDGYCKNVNDLMKSLSYSEELSIFDTAVIKDFYDF